MKLALHRTMMKFQNCLLLLTVVAVNVGCVLTERHAFKIKVAYMNKMGNKMCLQTDFGDLPADHNLVDIGKPMNISGMDIIGQFCDEFRLSDHVTDILIVIPGRIKPSCHHYSDCGATIIVRNELIIAENSACYDIAAGHFVHEQGVDYVTNFQIRNIVPRAVTCQKNKIDKLMRPEGYLKSVGDFWSPVVDIEKNAVEQISKVGEQFTSQITDKFTDLQNGVNKQVDQITDQFAELQNGVTKQVAQITDQVTDLQNGVSKEVAQVSLEINQETSKVSKTIEANYEGLKLGLEKIETSVAKDVGLAEKIFHYCL